MRSAGAVCIALLRLFNQVTDTKRLTLSSPIRYLRPGMLYYFGECLATNTDRIGLARAMDQIRLADSAVRCYRFCARFRILPDPYIRQSITYHIGDTLRHLYDRCQILRNPRNLSAFSLRSCSSLIFHGVGIYQVDAVISGKNRSVISA